MALGPIPVRGLEVGDPEPYVHMTSWDHKYCLKQEHSFVFSQITNVVVLKAKVKFLFSSVGEREDWFHTLSRAIADHAAGLCTFGGPCSEVRESLVWPSKKLCPLFYKVLKSLLMMLNFFFFCSLWHELTVSQSNYEPKYIFFKIQLLQQKYL